MQVAVPVTGIAGWRILRTKSKYIGNMLLLGVIVFSLISFVQNGLAQATSTDFYHFYVAGQLWREGQDAYDYNLFRSRLTQLAPELAGTTNSGYFYPPQTSAILSALAAFPVTTARNILLVTNLGLLIATLGLFSSILAQFRRLRLPEFAFLISLINTGFGRQNMRAGQFGFLICLLLLSSFVLQQRRRTGLAGLALGLASIKPTFIPLFLGMQLVKRSYRFVGMCVLTALFSVGIPLLVTQRSLVDSTRGWIQMIMQYNAADDINNPSPDTPYSALMLHATPLIYRILDAQSTSTTLAAIGIVMALCCLIMALIRRSANSPLERLLDFSLVAALSLISINHRSYDIFLLFPGLIFLYARTTALEDTWQRRCWAAFLIGVILLISLPGDLSVRISDRYPALLDSYPWRVIAPIQAWVSLVVLGVLLWCKLRLWASSERPRARS